MIGWFSAALGLDPRCFDVPVVFQFFIVGIHAFGISISLSLLMLLGWILMWIVSLTLRVYQWGSRSINFTLFQSGLCPVLWACSETGEVWVWASRMSLLHRSSSLADLNLDVASTYPTITLAFILNHPNTIRYTAMHDDTLHCTALQCNVVKLKILTPALRNDLRSIISALPPRTTLTSQPNLLIRGKGHKKPSCSTYTIITVWKTAASFSSLTSSTLSFLIFAPLFPGLLPKPVLWIDCLTFYF